MGFEVPFYLILALVSYSMLSPFVMIALQQSIFKESFDDEMGTKLIFRLSVISNIACMGYVAMLLGFGK